MSKKKDDFISVPINITDVKRFGALVNTRRRDIVEWPSESYHYEFVSESERNKGKIIYLLQQNRNRKEYLTRVRAKRVSGEKFNRFDYVFDAIIEHPEWINDHANEVFPRVMCLDIETESWWPRFPNPIENKILMVGYKIVGGGRPPTKVEILDIGNSKNSDKELLEELTRIIREDGVDIISTYYGRFFDLPYIAQRMIGHMTKEEKECFPIKEYYPSYIWAPDSLRDLVVEGMKEELEIEDFRERMLDLSKVKCTYDKRGNLLWNIPGFLLSYDIMHTDVKHKSDHQDRITYRDTSLVDLKSRSLKAVSKHYGYNPIQLSEEEIGSTVVLYEKDKQKFIDYLISDVEATEHLFNTYFYANLELAEHTNSPLSHMINREDGTTASILLEKELRKKNIYPLKKNSKKYQNYFKSSEHGGKFQAALVTVQKKGLFDKLYKVDFKSQYPSAMRTLNISPETVMEAKAPIPYKKSAERMMEKVLLEPNLFKFYRKKWNKKDTLFFQVPDEGFEEHDEGRLTYLAIDQSRKGVVIEMLENLADLRTYYKKKMSETKTEYERNLYNGKQMAIKVIMNSIFGFLSNEHSRQSNILCGIAITGFCRFLTYWLYMKHLKDTTVEIDTDGLIVDKKVDIEDLNNKIADFVFELTGIPHEKCQMKLEMEEFEYGYVYASKNYILYEKKKDGTLKEIKHGNGLKSTRMPKIFDRAVRIMIEQMFQNKYGSFDKASQKAHDIKSLPVEDFVQTMTLKYEPGSYKDTMPWVWHLVNTMKERGYTVSQGDQLEYVRTLSDIGYSPETDVSSGRKVLDYREYHRIIDTVIQTFRKDEEKKHVLF